MKLFKYEFTNKEEFDSLIQSIQIEENGEFITPSLKAKIELGFIKIKNGTYDEDGSEITAPVLSNKYCVDLIWENDVQPSEFQSYEVFPKIPKHKIF